MCLYIKTDKYPWDKPDIILYKCYNNQYRLRQISFAIKFKTYVLYNLKNQKKKKRNLKNL